MRFLRRLDIKRLIQHHRVEGISMHKRLALYLISALIMLISLFLLLLNFFGLMTPINSRTMDALDVQLSAHAENVERDCDRIAAYAISFAEQMETALQNYLSENAIDFDALKDDADTIADLQCVLYDTVYLNMQLAPSSGAFYILDTTVNSHTAVPHYSGIYLKYINLNSDSTVNNKFSLYRGSFVVGDSNGITFHSGWQNEMETDFFETCDSVFSEGAYYALSSAVVIPETWERARYVYVPIHDLMGKTIGVCGFEINDLYFRLTYKTTASSLGPVVYALLDDRQETYTGQFSSSRFSISDSPSAAFTITESGNKLIFDFGHEICIGKIQPVYLGQETFFAAAMLTQAQYDTFSHREQMKLSALLLIVAAFSLICCIFISKCYVAPILRKIEQVKANEEPGDSLGIREIDDLFAFLAEKDVHYEKQLEQLKQAKQDAEDAAQKAKAAYDHALEEYRLAQSEIHQLFDEKKKDIALEDYEYFICNLTTLTPTEYRIYELYLAGKSAKEIMEITAIKENTLKYHNRNIYSKLGISSRKQLLRFASLKQYRDSKGEQKA